jgi:hypothetical protein
MRAKGNSDQVNGKEPIRQRHRGATGVNQGLPQRSAQAGGGDRSHPLWYPASPRICSIGTTFLGYIAGRPGRMVSKCANPACSERFLYLHRGKLFHLNPTPEIEAADGDSLPALYERFWLCDQCCRKMTVVWGGTNARVVPLPAARVVQSLSHSGQSGSKVKAKQAWCVAQDCTGNESPQRLKRKQRASTGGGDSQTRPRYRLAPLRREPVRTERSSPMPGDCE